MKKQKLMLPQIDEEGNQYLSYSQISTWIRSKRDYIRRYFLGEEHTKEFLKPYGDFGHKVGEALENNDFSEFTEEETKLMKKIPRYDQFEREIKLEMGDFYIKGFIDTNTLVHKTEDSVPIEVVEKIADYKTGEISKRYPEYDSDNYLQIAIYAAGIKQQTGYLPKEAYVFLIQRDGNAFNNEELTLGNEFVTIKKDVSQETVDKVLEKVNQIAKDISDYYNMYLKMITIV